MVGTSLSTARLTVCVPSVDAAGEVAAYYARNATFHAPFDPPRPQGFRTAAYWKRQLQVNLEALEARSAARFFLFDDERVVGHASLSVIGWGPFCAANLGYALCESAQGRGLMHEALDAVLPWAFAWGLHRVQSNYLPTNTRSARLLERLGFEVEGRARAYLFIGGEWADHVLTARTSPVSGPPGSLPTR